MDLIVFALLLVQLVQLLTYQILVVHVILHQAIALLVLLLISLMQVSYVKHVCLNVQHVQMILHASVALVFLPLVLINFVTVTMLEDYIYQLMPLLVKLVERLLLTVLLVQNYPMAHFVMLVFLVNITIQAQELANLALFLALHAQEFPPTVTLVNLHTLILEIVAFVIVLLNNFTQVQLLDA